MTETPETQKTPEAPQAPAPATESPGPTKPAAAQQSQENLPIVQPLTRPSQQKPSQETGSVIVAKALAAQLASSPEFLYSMLIDERKLAVLDELVVTALNHFEYRNQVDKIRYWGFVVDGERVGSQGVGGIGRRHILTALANTSGIQAIDKADKPNVVARNLWNRDWKDKAAAQGKIVEE